MHDERTLIGRSLFQKESRIDKFVNLRVTLSTGETGTIEGAFGQSGKYKVRPIITVRKTKQKRWWGAYNGGETKKTLLVWFEEHCADKTTKCEMKQAERERGPARSDTAFFYLPP